MDGLIKKFNIFDLFTMLIPGIIISTLCCISISFKYYSIWKDYGNEKYIIFFVLSYLCGVIMQQIGNIIDEKFLYKRIYGGYPKQLVLSKNKYANILKNENCYNEVLKVKEYIIDKLDINTENVKTETENLKLNSFIFSCCLNILEMNNLTYKADKMLVISEMSRSLFWGNVLIIFINIIMIIVMKEFVIFFLVEILMLCVLCYIFLYRKIQFEQYRYREILRTFLIYIKNV